MNTHDVGVENVTRVRARRFDGFGAGGEIVEVRHQDNQLCLTCADGASLHFVASQVVATDDTDDLQRNFVLPDGTLLIFDSAQNGLALASSRSRIERWIKNKHATLLAVIAVLALPALILTIIVPGAVNRLAPSIPLTWEAALGESVFASLKKTNFLPSNLQIEHKARLTARFDTLKKSAGIESARLEFVGGLPNAFALPGGIVTITDQMVHLLDNDDRIAAVLAHELGHVKQRHALRGIATHTIAAQVLTVALTHDQLTQKVVDLVAQRSLTAKYSQQREREADRYRVNLDSGSYTSTHPPVNTRIAAARACAQEFDAAR